MTKRGRDRVLAERANEVLGWRPQRTGEFIGRERELAALAEMLPRLRRVALVPATSAPAGIGTTELALEYVDRLGSEYRWIFHVNAATAVQTTCELARLGRRMCGVPGRLEPARAVRAFREWLAANTDWLMVVDGVRNDSIVAPLLEIPTGRLLLTTSKGVVERLPSLPVLTVDLLRPRDVLDAFVAREIDDLENATAVARAMEFSPLGIGVASAVVGCSGCGWARFREALDSVDLPWLDRRQKVEATIAIALDGLARLRPTEMKLLCGLTPFVESLVPLDVLERFAGRLGRTLESAAGGRTGLRSVADELVHWNLARYVGSSGSDEPGGLSLLPSVRTVGWRSFSDEARRRWADRASTLAAAAFDDCFDKGDGDVLGVLPFASSFARRTLATGSEAPTFVGRVADVLQDEGFVLAAEELRTGLAKAPAVVRTPARRLAVARALGDGRAALGDALSAMRSYERVLTEAAPLDHDPDVALERDRARLGVATLFASQGRFKEADDELGPLLVDEVRPVVRGRAWLVRGRIDSVLQRWDKAAEAFDRAATTLAESGDAARVFEAELAACDLLVRRRRLVEAADRLDALDGECDPDSVNAPKLAELHRLRGEVLRLAGAFDEAGERFRRARTIDEVACGPESVAVGLNRAGWASVLQELGRHEEAIDEFEAAIDLVESPPSEDRLPIVLARISRSLLEVGDIRRAGELSSRALRLRSRRAFGRDLDLAEILWVRSLVLAWRGRPHDAIPLLRRGVAIVRECAGDLRDVTRPMRLELAHGLVSIGECAEAEELLRDCVEEYRLRSDRPDATLAHRLETTRAQVVQATCFERQERYAEAEALLEEVYEALEALVQLPEDRRRLPGVLRRLSRVQRLRGELDAADCTIVRALEEHASLGEGPDSPRVLRTKLEYVRLLGQRGDFGRAREELASLGADLDEGDDEGRSVLAAELGELHRLEGDLDAARSHFEASLELRTRAFGPRHETIPPCLDKLARLAIEAGDAEGAFEYVQQSVEIHRDADARDVVAEAESALLLATALRAKGAAAEAEEAFEEAVALRARVRTGEDPQLVAWHNAAETKKAKPRRKGGTARSVSGGTGRTG